MKLNEPKWLTIEAVLLMHEELIGRYSGTSGEGANLFRDTVTELRPASFMVRGDNLALIPQHRTCQHSASTVII